MTDRLTKDDWLKRGLTTLATDGAHALKVGPMATKLKVSRGSFYWHFKDVGDFQSQILRLWRERSTDQVIRELEAGKALPDRLTHLMKRAFAGKRNLERAIRSWATEDAAVARIVAGVDARRVAYIAQMLAAAGVDRQKALARAVFLYWAYLGQPLVTAPAHAAVTASALDDVGRLFVS
ncbi:MAG: TetR/AcrR family transcriptional regulator [Enhydrobacter sp.]